MRFRTLLLLFALAFCIYKVRLDMQHRAAVAESAGADTPEHGLQRMLVEFPTESQFHGVHYTFSDVSGDFRNTGSLLTPTVGKIRFRCDGKRYVLDFNWVHHQWEFDVLRNAESGFTMLHNDDGLALLSGAPMRAFLEPHGWTGALVDVTADAPALTHGALAANAAPGTNAPGQFMPAGPALAVPVAFEPSSPASAPPPAVSAPAPSLARHALSAEEIAAHKATLARQEAAAIARRFSAAH